MADTTLQDAALKSLSDAYLAADQGYLAAATADPASSHLPMLMAARNHALLAYLTATKESLVNTSPFTQKLKQDLDAETGKINAQLTTLKDIAAWLGLLDTVAKLAGSLASAFA